MAASMVACEPPPRPQYYVAPVPPSDAPRPTESRILVDFGPLIVGAARNGSVFSNDRPREMLSRVMVSPNVVFESSRTSLADAPTIGPAGEGPGNPSLGNALGQPVQIQHSSTLLRYLFEQRVAVVAPVVSRSWFCATEVGCAPTTWVERMMMLSRASPNEASADNARGTLPTSLLAVRTLGRATESVEISVDVAGANANGAVVRSAAQSPSGDCLGTAVQVPVFAFQAEFVSLTTGRVVARIDEVRPVATPTQAGSVAVDLVPWTAEYATRDGFRYVSRWVRGAHDCGAIQRALDGLAQQMAQASRDTNVVDRTVRELLAAGLGPLAR